MDPEKQRQRRHDDVKLTQNENARSEKLLVMPTVSLTNREWLQGELLSGSECQRPTGLYIWNMRLVLNYLHFWSTIMMFLGTEQLNDTETFNWLHSIPISQEFDSTSTSRPTLLQVKLFRVAICVRLISESSHCSVYSSSMNFTKKYWMVSLKT